MKNIYFCSLFVFFSTVSPYTSVFSADTDDKASDDTACEEGYIYYQDKCVQECDEKVYPLSFVPDANRGNIESCEGKTSRYRYTECFEDKGWYWNDAETECVADNCTGYSVKEQDLNSQAGTFEPCLFYGQTTYKYTSCNSGWDGPQDGQCLEHKCSVSDYPYLQKSEAEAVCADAPVECMEGSSLVKYGCNGNCKDSYYSLGGACLLTGCNEKYPYNAEIEAAGCKKIRSCDLETFKSAYGCDAARGCKEGYYQDGSRCLANACSGYFSDSNDISDCIRTESCLRGTSTVYKCSACRDGYRVVSGYCQQNESSQELAENSQICHIGDIYYDDGTCFAHKIDSKNPIGIIVDPDNKVIMALSYARKNWDTFDANQGYDIPEVVNIPIFSGSSWSDSVHRAEKDLNGEYNTDSFIDYERQHHVRFPAIEYCNNMRVGKKRWFVPSAGQLAALGKHWEILNNALSRIGATTITSDATENDPKDNYFWSSTEASLPCSEDEACYKNNALTFTSRPKHMIVVRPIKVTESVEVNPPHLETAFDYIGKYFTDAPLGGAYTICFANYLSHDTRPDEDETCVDYPFYNEESDSIYNNINEMYSSGRALKASELAFCTDSYGTWYKPTKCPKGYTLDNFGCYPTDCSAYRNAPTSPKIEGCQHFTTCESPNITYYLCDLCERPYELTNNYTCLIR